MKVIARMYTDFPEKFGIPRQSGLVQELKGRILLEPEYRREDALRGLEGFSHIWLLWEFSQSIQEKWSPTVRPPRLGGNTRLGVFATRSPFRPNPIGLSCVRLDKVQMEKEGPALYVSGGDLLDGTPIYDIKPYLPYTDAHPEAAGGWAEKVRGHSLEVEIPPRWLLQIPPEYQTALAEVLAQDPRPSYQEDPERVYGMGFAGMEIRFRVSGRHLTVCEVKERTLDGEQRLPEGSNL